MNNTLRSAEGICLDQTLHGYMDGHRLLASSVQLPKSALRAMLVLSDMSGSNLVSGFESYVTGYPVDSTEYYAFAKTWYAHEMSRPGCAWTHTLLIKARDLEQVPFLGNLANEFRRPQGGKVATGLYEKTIWLSSTLTLHPAGYTHVDGCQQRDTASWLVAHLYGHPENPPILLLCDSSRECEDLILSVWSQQWPALRTHFTFCTGSLANRLMRETPFDLQAIPRKMARSIEREVPAAFSVDVGSAPSDDARSAWVAIVTDDIVSDVPTGFRRFLWALGDTSHPMRSDVQRLARIYGEVERVNKGESMPETLLSELVAQYPDADDGRALKAAILCPGTDGRDTLIRNVSESDMLCALARFDHDVSPLPIECLQLRSRAAGAWRKEPAFRTRVHSLLTAHINPLGEEVLAGVADVISPPELIQLSRENRRLVFSFVEHRPLLACGHELWVGESDYQRELFDHVRRASLPYDSVQPMIKAMLDGGADIVATDAYTQYGGSALHAFLDWYNEHIGPHIGDAYRCWIGLIGEAPGETLEWLHARSNWRPELVAIIVSKLNPHSALVQARGTELWARILDTLEYSVDDRIRRMLAEFLLPLSLQSRGPSSERLARFAFPIIHEALARNIMSYEAWRHLDAILPHLPLWKSWDRCERLRRGMKEAGFAVPSI